MPKAARPQTTTLRTFRPTFIQLVVGFQYNLDQSTWSYEAVDAERGITVHWAGGLGRRPERGERGDSWRFDHADWSFTIFVEGEEWGIEAVSNPSNSRLVSHFLYSSGAGQRFWSYSNPKKTMLGIVPDDITVIIAEAMLTIYSRSGEYPGTIEYWGPHGLKRTYEPKR